MNYISIGGWCGTKIALKDLGLFDRPSLPFDSVRCSIEGVINCIENDFKHFFPDPIVRDESISDWFAFIGKNVSFFHHDHNLYDENVINMFKRRIDRFHEFVKQDYCIFVRVIIDDDYMKELQQMKKLCNAIETKYPGIHYRICFIVTKQKKTLFIRHINEKVLLFSVSDDSGSIDDIKIEYKPIFDYINSINIWKMPLTYTRTLLEKRDNGLYYVDDKLIIKEIPSTNKTLVIILSETRAHELTFQNFKENVMEPLKADLCVCIGVKSDYDYTNPYYEMAKYHFLYKEPDDFGDAFEEAYQSTMKDYPYNTNIYWREYLKIKDQYLGGIKDDTDQHPGSAAILIFFRWFLLRNLQMYHILDKYDRFVITRSDYIYKLPHPKLDILDSKNIWIPDEEHYGGYTDRHVILPRRHVEKYLNILPNMILKPEEYYHTMKGKNNWNLERLIKHHLQQNNIDKYVREFPYVMYSVRSQNGSTRWSGGTYIEELGYCIKYDTEYHSACTYEHLFKQSKKTIDYFYDTICNNVSTICLTNNELKMDKPSCQQLYEILFSRYKYEPIQLLQIGLEPYETLQTRASYFTNATIYGFELYNHKLDHVYHNYPFVKLYQTNTSVTEILSDSFKMVNTKFEVIINTPRDENKQQNVISTAVDYIKKGGYLVLENVDKSNVAALNIDDMLWITNKIVIDNGRSVILTRR